MGTLYVVATPIGNLGDMVPRAVEILKAVDVIAAEDTRNSIPLMRHFSIATPLRAYHDFSNNDQTQWFIDQLLSGKSVAMISDAGTPLISDPGYRLVDLAHQHRIKVCPVPGACAAIAGLSVSGLATDRFRFEGFLPAKSGARLRYLQSLDSADCTLIFYEAPHRLLASLRDMQIAFGDDRVVVLAREITKMFETIRRAPLVDLANWVESDSNQQRGECVLMVSAAPTVREDFSAECLRAVQLLAAELPLKKACAITAELYGAKKNALYSWCLENIR